MPKCINCAWEFVNQLKKHKQGLKKQNSLRSNTQMVDCPFDLNWSYSCAFWEVFTKVFVPSQCKQEWQYKLDCSYRVRGSWYGMQHIYVYATSLVPLLKSLVYLVNIHPKAVMVICSWVVLCMNLLSIQTAILSVNPMARR